MIDNFIKNQSLKALLIMFFNTEMLENNNFRIYSKFRRSKFSKENLTKHIYERELQNINKYSNFNFTRQRSTIFYDIDNNNSISFDEYINKLYLEILSRIVEASEEFEIALMIGIFSMRGSYDQKLGYYSVDMKSSTDNHFDKIFKLLLQSEKILNYLNLNFRELQAQYVAGTNLRDTQLRINIGYFYTFNHKLREINEYKANILDSEANLGKIKPAKEIGVNKIKSTFIERISFYKENILGKKISAEQIDLLRQNLFIQEGSETISRNQKIRTFIQETIDDECVGCSDIYDIKDRSFIMPNNNNHWYLEINHVLPFADNKEENDVVDNLVKLCAVCHRALTPNRASEDLQKSIIKKMIDSRKEVDGFVEMMMQKSGKTDKVQFVFESLR